MLTTKNQAAFSAKDKQNQLISHIALCPGIYLFVMGLISFQFLFPWNAATFPLSSGDMDTAMNQTYTAAYNAWEFFPCAVDETLSRESDEKGQTKCTSQKFHPVIQEKAEATGKREIVERGDWYNCDLPGGCHMRFMIQEEARSAGMFFIGIGVACIYSFVSKAHYAARAVSGLHLFLAVYSLLHGFVLLFQYYDPDLSFVPYLYRQNMAMGVNVIAALIFIVMGVLNIVAMAMGMSRAGELTANARASNIASSGLVCGPVGSPEFKAMDGGNKGKQVVSSAGLCCIGLQLLVPALYFSWMYVGGVTFHYYGAGDTSNMFMHENATMAVGHTFMFNAGYNAMKTCDKAKGECVVAYDYSTTPATEILDEKKKVNDCVGKHGVNMFRLNTDLKMKPTKPDTVFGSGEQCEGKKECPIEEYEMQECNGPYEDIGKEDFHNYNYGTPDAFHAYHQVRVHAKLGGAFIWATVIASFFSVIRGASYASRSVSGISLGMGVVGILYLVQGLCWFMFPDSHFVPQYWRDGANVTLLETLIVGGLIAGLNLAGFVVGIAKTKEVESGAAPAAAPAADAAAPPQMEGEAPKAETA